MCEQNFNVNYVMLVTLRVIEMYRVRLFLSFPSDGDVLITYRGRMKELILIFEQRLRLAYESEYSVLHDFFNSLSCWDVVKHSFIHFQFSHAHTQHKNKSAIGCPIHHVPASAPRLVYQKLWYVLSCLGWCI